MSVFCPARGFLSLLEAREKAFCHRQPLEFAKAQHRALKWLARAKGKPRARAPESLGASQGQSERARLTCKGDALPRKAATPAQLSRRWLGSSQALSRSAACSTWSVAARRHWVRRSTRAAALARAKPSRCAPRDLDLGSRQGWQEAGTASPRHTSSVSARLFGAFATHLGSRQGTQARNRGARGAHP